MANVIRFIGYIVFCLGFFTTLLSFAYFLYRKLGKRSYRRTLNKLFDESQRVFAKFRKFILRDDLIDAEYFFINEMKRLKVKIPRRFPELRERFVKMLVISMRKHRSSLGNDLQSQFPDRMQFEIFTTLKNEFKEKMNRSVFSHVMILIPIVVAGATFFPLLFYTRFYILLVINSVIFYTIGRGLLVIAAVLFLSANQ
jgi:hypothetical protein